MIQMFSNNKWQCTTVSKFQYFCSLCLLVMVSFTRNQPEKLVDLQFERIFFSFVSIFSPHLMIFLKFYSTFCTIHLKNKYCKNIGKNLLTPAHFSIALPKPGRILGSITIASSSLTYFCRRCCQRMLYLLMIPAN